VCESTGWCTLSSSFYIASGRSRMRSRSRKRRAIANGVRPARAYTQRLRLSALVLFGMPNGRFVGKVSGCASYIYNRY